MKQTKLPLLRIPNKKNRNKCFRKKNKFSHKWIITMRQLINYYSNNVTATMTIAVNVYLTFLVLHMCTFYDLM